MKTANLPSLRSLREPVNRRRVQAEFIARSLASREESRLTCVYYTVDEVMGSLRNILQDARAKNDLR